MLHTNMAELRLLCDTFTRVWSAGGQANLSLQTKDSQMWAKLYLQLGPADGHRPGPPVAGESIPLELGFILTRIKPLHQCFRSAFI